MNLLDGTKDFSGYWNDASGWPNDETYKGLTVKKKTSQWGGINKSLTIQTSNSYTFSTYVKGAGTGTAITRRVSVNGIEDYSLRKTWSTAFDWVRDSVTLTSSNIKRNDIVSARYEISVLGTNQALWNAGHKWEPGSTATPYMPSASEVTVEDYPSYIGTYTDSDSNTQSTDPEKYVWKKID